MYKVKLKIKEVDYENYDDAWRHVFGNPTSIIELVEDTSDNKVEQLKTDNAQLVADVNKWHDKYTALYNDIDASREEYDVMALTIKGYKIRMEQRNNKIELLESANGKLLAEAHKWHDECTTRIKDVSHYYTKYFELLNKMKTLVKEGE